LSALFAQDFGHDRFEILIGDDGSTDGSPELVESVASPVPLRVLRQAQSGTATARNLGVANARGEAVLFLDADVFAAPNLLRLHWERYARDLEAQAIQGASITHPETITNTFMWTTAEYPDLTRRRHDALNPLHVIGRNLSVRRTAFEVAGRFDEGFIGYGFQDVEFALRLERRAGPIRYVPEAIGAHHHVVTAESALVRQRQAGRNAVYFWRKYGRPFWLAAHLEILPVLMPLKRVAYGTRFAQRLMQRVRALGERTGSFLLLNEAHNCMRWQGYYEGVFAALTRPPRSAPSSELSTPAT
jgi:glycosyltransferase involved in cell wall biosynthesis